VARIWPDEDAAAVILEVRSDLLACTHEVAM
jgi:hypothetical protein